MRTTVDEVMARSGRLHTRSRLRLGARHRFAAAGLALSVAATFGGAAIARRFGLPVEVTVASALGLAFLVLGFGVGRMIEELTASSLQDPMTHIGNRRHWEERLHDELVRASTSGMPMSVLVVDVDNLKTLNDRHGHAVGDVALAQVAEALAETCRSRDVAARLGGDEFGVLLPRTRASEAVVAAERVREALAARRARLAAPLDALLTVSIGVADLEAVGDSTAAALFDAADRALYAAKEGGRDRIHVAPKLRPSGVIRLDDHRPKPSRKNG